MAPPIVVLASRRRVPIPTHLGSSGFVAGAFERDGTWFRMGYWYVADDTPPATLQKIAYDGLMMLQLTGKATEADTIDMWDAIAAAWSIPVHDGDAKRGRELLRRFNLRGVLPDPDEEVGTPSPNVDYRALQLAPSAPLLGSRRFGARIERHNRLGPWPRKRTARVTP